MNDIYHTSKLLNFILFADDTTDFYLNSNVDTLYDTINDELIEVSNWFKFNKLSLNASKTNLMFIGTPNQTKQVNDSRHIHLDGCKLTRVTEAKFLDALPLVQILRGYPISIASVRKCSKSLGVLNKIKHFILEKHMYQIYSSLIMSYLNYGILLRGSVNKEHIRGSLESRKRLYKSLQIVHI